MICKISEFFWPRLEPETEQEKQELHNELQNMLEEIDSANWKSAGPILEEARILSDREHQRRKSADTKATVYLGILAAVIPLVAAVMEQLLDFIGAPLTWIAIPLHALIIVGILYLLSAGRWAFKAIKVREHYRVGDRSLIDLQHQESIQSGLCKEILTSVRKNLQGTNEKTTYVIMAHHFILRAFVVFSLVILTMGILAIVQLLPWHWIGVCKF